MRNLILTLVVIVLLVGSSGYGIHHIRQQISAVNSQMVSLNQSQQILKSDLSQIKKELAEVSNSVSSNAHGSGNEARERDELNELKRNMEILRKQISSSSAVTIPAKPVWSSSMQSAMPAPTSADVLKRCQFVEDYLIKLEQIYTIKDSEQRTVKRIELDNEYKATRRFLEKDLGQNWITTYEDALQSAHYVQDPIRNAAAQAKIKPLFQTIISKCKSSNR